MTESSTGEFSRVLKKTLYDSDEDSDSEFSGNSKSDWDLIKAAEKEILDEKMGTLICPTCFASGYQRYCKVRFKTVHELDKHMKLHEKAKRFEKPAQIYEKLNSRLIAMRSRSRAEISKNLGYGSVEKRHRAQKKMLKRAKIKLISEKKD